VTELAYDEEIQKFQKIMTHALKKKDDLVMVLRGGRDLFGLLLLLLCRYTHSLHDGPRPVLH
jgi:hypothetical protein